MSAFMWALAGGLVFMVASGLAGLIYNWLDPDEPDDEYVLPSTLLALEEAKTCAQLIAEKKVRVGEDWMKINPALFRVVYVHYAELVSATGDAKRLTTIIVRGVRPGTKIPRIVAKLEDSIIPLGFKREEIKVVVEAQK